VTARELDQADVTWMQVAHGRHERDAPALGAPGAHLLPDDRDLVDLQHRHRLR
jgi:hypothetical protein